MPHKKLIKLNLGAGKSRFKGFLNVDVEKSTKPDIICDFVLDRLPFEKNSVDEVVCFHTIEHIQKRLHSRMLNEIYRVLKKGCPLYLSYPEFTECYERWKSNYRGQKAFWEKTIFGRQLYPSDHHVCIMHTPDFVKTLGECGFEHVVISHEKYPENHNTIIKCLKGKAYINYEEIVYRDMTKFQLVKLKTA